MMNKSCIFNACNVLFICIYKQNLVMPKKARRKKSKSKSSIDKDDELIDINLTNLKSTITQICKIYGVSNLKTNIQNKKGFALLKFKLKKVGSETEDQGRIRISYFYHNKSGETDESELTYRFTFRMDGDEKQSVRTGLMIGRKILMDYLHHSGLLNNSDTEIDEVDLLGYLDISSDNVRGVLHDLICRFNSVNMDNGYHYLNLCIKCIVNSVELDAKTISKVYGTHDLYSRLCDECKVMTSELVVSNIVMDAYRTDPNIVKFLLLLSLEALGSTNRFTPYPTTYNEGKLIDTYAGAVNLYANISKEMDYWTSKLNSVDTDRELFTILNGEAREYEFIKFVVESNNTVLSYFDTQIGSSNNSADMMIRETDIWDKSDLIVFAVTHDAELEDRFNKVEKSTYFYHGSPAYNWHSILRNGLKNYSGTNKQSHGAAHGSGIYLSESSDYSLGYSGRSKTQFSVIAIAQVIDAPSYKKTGGIYVVPDESKVLIKYLLLNKGTNNDRKRMNKIFKYLTVTLPHTLDHNRGCMNFITDKRLRGEYAQVKKKIRSIGTKSDLVINIDETVQKLLVRDGNDGEDGEKNTDTDEYNLTLKSRTWTIQFDGIVIDAKIVIDISYQYPLVPPKINVESTIDNLDQKIPLLIKDADNYRYREPAMSHLSWKPSTKICSIIEFLVKAIIEYN
jgi:Poly(ADP-ribose) polymerase catalytic domain